MLVLELTFVHNLQIYSIFLLSLKKEGKLAPGGRGVGVLTKATDCALLLSGSIDWLNRRAKKGSK